MFLQMVSHQHAAMCPHAYCPCACFSQTIVRVRVYACGCSHAASALRPLSLILMSRNSCASLAFFMTLAKEGIRNLKAWLRDRAVAELARFCSELLDCTHFACMGSTKECLRSRAAYWGSQSCSFLHAPT